MSFGPCAINISSPNEFIRLAPALASGHDGRLPAVRLCKGETQRRKYHSSVFLPGSSPGVAIIYFKALAQLWDTVPSEVRYQVHRCAALVDRLSACYDSAQSE
jgi:hypothetical protein